MVAFGTLSVKSSQPQGLKKSKHEYDKDHYIKSQVELNTQLNNHKIKTFEVKGTTISIKTYKSNHQYETITPSSVRPDYRDIYDTNKKLNPFKEGDNITITNNKDEHPHLQHELWNKGNKIEFKSKSNNKSVELQYAVDRKIYYAFGFYSSEVEVKPNNKRSIRYTIRVRDKQKTHLFEHRLRWIVDDKGDFKCWQEPQFLGDTQLYGYVERV